MLYNYGTQTIVNKTLTELPDGLIDCHVVGDHVIIDQKLELVTNAISLIHQNGGLQQQKKQDEITYADDALTRLRRGWTYKTVVHVIFAVIVVAIGQVLVPDAAIAADHQILFDGLYQSEWIDFDGASFPLLDIVAGRMPL
jgi:hypothetical protein